MTRKTRHFGVMTIDSNAPDPTGPRKVFPRKATTVGHHDVEWIDKKLWPRCPANPKYPDGYDAKITEFPGVPTTGKTCKVDLPYPARRIGMYIVACHLCGFTAALSTAGRRDDPRSITMPCKAEKAPDGTKLN